MKASRGKVQGSGAGRGGQRSTWLAKLTSAACPAVCGMAAFPLAVSAEDIFSMAKSAMQTVYSDVAGIATVAAVVCAAVCLFLMNFSKSGRTVDESRAWLKRIIICWAAIMTLGAIVSYLEKIIPAVSYSAG